jgi:hypothetical protein
LSWFFFQFGPCRPKAAKAFLVAWIGEALPPLANNKTAAIAGRCSEKAYRGGRPTRQSTKNVEVQVKIVIKQ